MLSALLLSTIVHAVPGISPAVPLVVATEELPLAQIQLRPLDPALSSAELAAEFGQRGFDVLGFVDDGLGLSHIELIASAQELHDLREQGYTYHVVQTGRPLGETAVGGKLALGTPVPAGYPDLAAIEVSLLSSAAAHPNLARVVNLTQAYGMPTTVEGRNLLALVISDNVTIEEDEPAVLLVSAHHAREIVTPLIALESIDRLLSDYGTDPDVTQAVNAHEIWIVPVQNPDGYNHVFTQDNFWRKNRRVFPTGTGVDLNRNYPPGWGGGCGGSTSAGSSTYQGPSPSSEPETQTLIALSDDRHFAKVLDFHSFGQEARYGYGCWTHPLELFLSDEATAISTAAGWAGDIGSSCCLAGDIHYQMRSGAHAFLLETATTFQPSFAAGEAEAQAVWLAIEQFLGRDISVSGHITDANSMLPVDGLVQVSGINFANGESFGSGGDFGRYHATLPNGMYTLTVQAAGYLDSIQQVTVAVGSPVTLDVALVPEPNAWQDLGGGSLGSAGIPGLSGTGTLEANTLVTLDLQAALPNALLLGWISTSSSPLFAAGGTLYTNPLLHQFQFMANTSGQLGLPTTWPAGLPSGTQLWVQFVCEDGGVVFGFTLSNALLGTTP